MNEPPGRSILARLFQSRLGRMALLGGGLLALAGFLTNGCKGRAKPSAGPESALGRGSSPGLRKSDLPPSPTGFDESLPAAGQYKALVLGYGERVTSTEKELEKTRKELELIRASLEAAQAARRKEEARQDELQKEVKETPHRHEEPGLKFPRSLELPSLPSPALYPAPGLRTLEFPAPPPAGKEKGKAVHITAATAGQATLMNGVFAPTSGEPSPVRLRFDAALLGPNRSRIPMRGAFLIGKAQGDANSSRVTIQVEKLATVKATGESVETKVLGYVVGEDGLEGVPGSYEWRALQVLPLAGLAGGITFGAQAMAERETSTSLTPLGGATNFVTGDPLKFAGFRTASGASGKMGELVTERLREIRPAVSTAAGKKVHVVFLEGVTLEGLNVEEIDYGRDHDPFQGLDLHR